MGVVISSSTFAVSAGFASEDLKRNPVLTSCASSQIKFVTHSHGALSIREHPVTFTYGNTINVN